MNLTRVVAIVAMAVGLPAVASADRAVTGTVVDGATGSPVPGAFVTVGGGETAHRRRRRVPDRRVRFGRVEVVVLADGYRAYASVAGTARAITPIDPTTGVSGLPVPITVIAGIGRFNAMEVYDPR